MSGEIKAPLLCLKAGVKRVLYMNERKELKTAPVIKDGDILIPREALAIAGIEIEDDYASSRELRGLHKVYEGMGLIFLDDHLFAPPNTLVISHGSLPQPHIRRQ